ncbi:hypothetical protein TNCT_761 [Trichonephila clavata]|uniref:Uncharacterized protein n=1 Tax=Trichonephila clavata TaxID=2740835 RepID=A0A8X6F585_TRICU|nr:hypothetical protein TNCT_761 [Trichonephila clavata]
MSVRRGAETFENRETRLEAKRIRAFTSRAAETSQQHYVRVADLRARASLLQELLKQPKSKPHNVKRTLTGTYLKILRE